jgi:RNA polymerase sigma factor (sigma-70 family)
MAGIDAGPPGHDRAQHQATSFHVQRAVTGDAISLEWLVARLSPLLRAQAAYRLDAPLRAVCEPDDLVQEAWLVLLPRLGELRPREGRYTPVLLRFLATVLLQRVRNLTRRQMVRQGRSAGAEPVEAVPADASGAVTKALQRERHDEVRRCLDELATQDREILILRGIEQQSIKTTATVLGLGEEAVAKRYLRALARLRQALPRSVFDELA